MEIPVKLNEEKKLAKVVYATNANFAFLDKWRADLGESQNPRRRDSVDFAELASYRYTAHCKNQPYATSTEEVRDYITDDPNCEVEMRLLLAAATTANQVPFVVFGGFAGLRSAEIARLEWRDVDLAAKQIEIKAAKAKTRSRRLVPISDNLVSWLEPLVRKDGRVSMIDRPDLMVSSLAERCEPKVTWRRNGLRHSFVSYRLALIGNEHQVSMECGHKNGACLWSTFILKRG